MGVKKITDDVWVDILNRVVLRPRLKPAARAAGIDPSSLFLKIKQSIADPENHKLVWLDTFDTFANHLQTARRLSIVELDRAALQLGIEGHSQPRYHDGRPVYKRDLRVEADALTMTDDEWTTFYGNRRRDLGDDVVVAGTPQHRAFQDAGIEVNAVRAETLLDEGFQNEFLFELAPGYKPKIKPQPEPMPAEEVAQKAQEKIAKAAPPGKASARYDSENLGYGKPPPGGRRVCL